MSGGLDVLAMKEDDVVKLLAANAHLGDSNVDLQMAHYVYKVKADGECVVRSACTQVFVFRFVF